MEEVLHNFYDEIKEHIEDDKCYTMQCNNLIKLTITEKCIGCGACKRVCPVDCIAGERKQQHNIKSPMQMFATVAKDIWAKEKGLKRD